MRSISAGQSSNAIARGGAQPVCLFLSTTGTCPTRLRSWFGRCQIARASMPLPSNRQQAVAKALCPRGSLPDPPSGGSGVPERGIPLVCRSYALVPETYLGQRRMTHFVQKGPVANSKGTICLEKGLVPD